MADGCMLQYPNTDLSVSHYWNVRWTDAQKRIVANGQLEFVGAGEKRRRGKEGENIIFTLSWLCCSVCCSAVLVCGSTR